MSLTTDAELHAVKISKAGRAFSFWHVDEQDHIFREIGRTQDFYEAELLAQLGALLAPNDLVIDVGANIGNHSIYFAAVAGARVIAFEPHPVSFSLLKRNISANRLTGKIKPRQVALGQFGGRAQFQSIPQHNLGGASLQESAEGDVTLERLDDLQLPAQPRLIKIDAEGMDFAVLQGAQALIERERPIICVEAADTRLFDEIFAFLKPFGYLPGEPFNFTPTHIFQTDATDAAFKTSVAHFMARAHIDLMRLDGGLRRQVADQYQRIGALEKERLPALAADAGALKAQLNAVSETMEQQSAAADNVREGMRDELGRMAETVDALEARLPVQLGAAIERTAKDLCDRFETLDAAVAHIPPLLRALDAEQEGRLSALPEAVLERLRRRIDGLDDAAAQTLALLRRLTNDDVETTAATRLDLNRLLARLLDRDGALLANIQSRVDASLDQSADRLHGRFELLEQAAARLFARIEQPQESGAKTDALREAIGAVESRLIALADMRQRLEALTAFEARLSALDALSARIDESGERVGARIEAALHVLPFARQEEQRVLGEAVARLQAELPDAVAEAIRREIATVSARTESQIDALEQRLSRAQASQSEALAQVARALQQHSAQQAAIAATFADMQASQARLQTQIEAQQARLESLDSQWAEQLGFQAAEIVTRIESHLDGAVLALGAHPDSPPPPADLQSGAPLAAAAAPAPSTAPALATRSLAQFHCGADWRQIWPHQDVALMSEGRVLVRQTKSTPGIVSAAFAAPEGGGVLRIRVTAAVPAHSASKPHVRLCDSEGARMGPDMPLREGASEHFFFLSRRVKQVKAYVIVHQPSENYSFAIQDITIDAVEAESYFAQQRAQIAAPVIASLATIPSRLPMLHDCVESLLVQADTVRVFLNGYDHVPEFLRHPRVEFRRSQDWDDKGDAGKFGWIESHDAPGYRLIVDDDLLFPPDFAANMAAAVKRHQDRAICALHGILLKQPITQYYDPKSRTAFHFQNALAHERTCHVLGSNAMCFHSAAVRMRWADFMFRNMGDIWLAGYAQQHKLPMIAVARPAYWVRQNQQKERFDTIYDHSLKRSGSRFDSSAVQDALVKHMAPLTMQPTSRPKIVFVVLAEDAQRVAALLRQWKDKRKLDIDWAVIAIALEDDPHLMTALSEMALDHEYHFISSAGLSAGERLGEGLRLLQRLAPAGALLLRDTATLTHSGWSDGVRAAAGRQSSFRLGADALLPAGLWLSGEAIANAPAPDGALHAGALAWADWAQRLSLAAAAAGDLLAGAVQAPPSTAAITLPDRARAIAAPPAPPIKASPPTINGFFERVVVLNLDRRPDRWESMQRKLQRAGITAERFAAIDGQTPDIAADYAAYAAGALAPAPENARPISASRAFYLDYDSQAARVAFIEATAQRKAIASAGAWGYLKSMEAVLEQALADQVSSLLVLDDDVLFHRDARTLFADAVKELPADWLILQLGTLQYHWTNDWLHWRTERLYQTNGSAIGSHAVGMRFDIIPFLLEQIKKMELPYDTGALSAATGAFKDRCFVTYPNIAIQQLVDTDIGTSDFQASAGRTNAAETYRWSLSDYEE